MTEERFCMRKRKKKTCAENILIKIRKNQKYFYHLFFSIWRTKLSYCEFI